MNFVDVLSVILIGFGLSADCFAVALSAGAACRVFSLKNTLKVALAFGLFQMVMPIVGWLAGQVVVGFISRYDHWVAFALLAFIGGKMIIEFIRNDKDAGSANIESWGVLITLAVATSIDALAVGLSFALLEINIWIASAIIGVVAFSVSAFSFWLGRKVSTVVGRWALLAGGVILIGIGLEILLSHMLKG
jgi:manganese efflux pump family protein